MAEKKTTEDESAKLAAENEQLKKQLTEKTAALTALETKLTATEKAREAAEKAREKAEKEKEDAIGDAERYRQTLHQSKVASLKLKAGQAQILEPTPVLTIDTANKRQVRVELKVGDVVITKGEPAKVLDEIEGSGSVYLISQADFDELVELKLATPGI